ncbi:MAG: 2-phosphosulfolactate phosphatase [Candidatus Omnitrophota bacterium]|nr:MAG: 2-phosphosulfolactate phosphatase [Candidatus Omnitrophota bacterium]
MLLDVIFTWNELKNRDMSGKTLVVADVLRATTVMVRALSKGAKKIIPQESDQAARALYTTLQEQGIPTLLCGEKNGFKLEGYDLGNSPNEFTAKKVRDKTIIHFTTNGTKALAASAGAQQVLIACFSNRSAVGNRLSEWRTQPDASILLVASGREGMYCLEDTVCLGSIAVSLLGPPDGSVELTDAARSAVDLFELYRGRLSDMVKQCFHGRYLESIGLGGDLTECVKMDKTQIVPEMRNGQVVLSG